MAKKRKSKLSLSYIAVGCAFLFIPAVSVFDVMPDFIGYFLMIYGTGKLYDLNADIASARSMLIKLFFIDLVKTVLTPLLISFNDETTVMTFVFIFAVLQGIMLFYALGALFVGLQYLASRLGAKRADVGYSDLSVITAVFVIARYALCTIPELTVMTSRKYQMTDDLSPFTVYDYKTLITATCFVISLIIGLYFLTYSVKYLNGLNKDGDFINKLYEKYENEVLCDHNLLLRRNMKNAARFFIAAFLFACPVLFEGIDITPTFICFFLMAIGFSFAGKHLKSAKKLRNLCIVLMPVSALLYAFSSYVCSKYYHWSYTIHEKAVFMYKLSAAAQCVDTVLLYICAALSLKIFCELLNEYGVDKTISKESFQYRSQKNTVKKVKTVFFVCLAATAAICIVSCVLFFVYIQNEICWLFTLLFTLIWAAFCGWVIMKIFSLIEDNNI